MAATSHIAEEINVTGIPPIPMELRIDSWKRQKDIITGVFKGETGIGQALRNMKLAYDAVQWQYFDPHTGGPLPKPRTIDELDARQATLRDKKGQIVNLKGKIGTVRGLCQQFGDKWERSSVVPKATRIYVQLTMTKACDDFADDLDDIGTAGYDIVRAEIKRVEKMANDMLKGWVKDLGAAIPKVKANATVENYDELMHQNVRGMGTALARIPKYKALYVESWQDMADDSFMAHVTDGKQVKAKVALVEAALTKLKLAMKS